MNKSIYIVYQIIQTNKKHVFGGLKNEIIKQKQKL